MDTGTELLILRLVKDWQFGAAMLAALFFWGALFLRLDAPPNPDWPLQAPMIFLLPAVVYPVLEEIVFRGALQGGLWKTFLAGKALGPLSAPNILTAVVFGAVHLYSQAPLAALSIVIPGLIFGYFRDRYQHLLPCILLHIFYNAGFLILFGSA